MPVKTLCFLCAVLALTGFWFALEAAPVASQDGMKPVPEQPKPQPKTSRPAAPSTIKFADEGETGLRIVEGSVSTLGSDQPLKNFRLIALAKFEDGANKSTDLDSDANGKYRIELGKKVAQLRVFAYGDFVIPDSWSNVAIASMKFEKAETWDLKVRPNVPVTLKGTIKLSTTGKPVDNGCAVYLAPLDVRQDGSMRVFEEPLPTRCDADGKYEFKTPAGFYRLWAIWTDRSEGRWIFCSGIVQRVDLFKNLTQDFSIEPAPQIIGKVSDARDGSPVISRIDLYTNAYLRQLNNTTSDGEFRDDEAAEGDPILPAGTFRIRLYNVDVSELAAIVRPRSTDSVMHLERGLSYAALKGQKVEWKLYAENDIRVDLAIRTEDMHLPVFGTDVRIEANRLDDPAITHLRSAFELRALTDENGVAHFVGLLPGDYSVYIEEGTVLLGNLKVTGAKQQNPVMDYSLPFAVGSVKYPDGSICNTALCEVNLELPEGGARGPFFPDPFANKVLREKGTALVPLTLKGATFKLKFLANDGNKPAPEEWTPSQYPWRSKEIAFKVDAEKAYKFEVTLDKVKEAPEKPPEAAPMLNGEFWYRIEDDKGKAQGYTRMIVKGDAGQSVDWEMKVAFTGGSYEESRTLAWDNERRFVSSSYSADGKLICEGTRKEGKVSGQRTNKDRKLEPFTTETPDDALPYMGFLLAATMPLREGESWMRKELDEANGFADKGELKFELHKDTITWDGKEIPVWRAEITKPADAKRKLTLWISPAREIVKINWGGNVQILSRESTAHLYKKSEPAMKETAASSKEWLELDCVVENMTPEKLFDYFTKPELLTKWWPPEAEIEPKVGGKYRAIWKKQNWSLEGTIKEFEPGKKFTFTWRWNETPADAPTLEVHVSFAAEGSHTRLTIKHGPNATDEKGQENRAGYIAGWQQFIAALKEEVKE